MADETLELRELVLWLLEYAENNRVKKNAFNSRIALISYDNAFEICSHFIWKNDNYAKKLVEEIGENKFRDFPGKVEFVTQYIVDHLHIPFEVTPEELFLFHRWRNELYHRGEGRLPDSEELALDCSCVTWTISKLLNLEIVKRNPPINYKTLGDFFLRDHFPTPEIRFLASLANLHKIINRFLLQNQSQNVDLYKLGLFDKYEYVRTHYQFFINIPLPKEFLDVRRKIIEEKELGISEISKVVKMSIKLKQATNNLNIKMRGFQKKLYENALQWTVTGSDQKTKIGVIQQPQGSGKTIVMMAYALELLKIINVPKHKILILTSHVLIMQQIYDFIVKEAETINEKIALVESTRDLVLNIENPNKWIIVSTIQKTNYIKGHQFKDLKLSIIADEITDSMIEKIMIILPCSSIIQFTSTGWGMKHNIIARLTLEEAVNRGMLRMYNL